MCVYFVCQSNHAYCVRDFLVLSSWRTVLKETLDNAINIENAHFSKVHFPYFLSRAALSCVHGGRCGCVCVCAFVCVYTSVGGCGRMDVRLYVCVGVTVWLSVSVCVCVGVTVWLSVSVSVFVFMGCVCPHPVWRVL